MGNPDPLSAGVVDIVVEGFVPNGSTLTLCVDRESRGKVYVFHLDGSDWELLSCREPWRIDWERVSDSHVTLGLVAGSFAYKTCEPASEWSGVIDLSVAIVDENNAQLAKESARFRVAPFLLASALDPVEEVLVVKNERTAGFVKELERIVLGAGARLRPVEFEGSVESDVWVQDTVEIGRVCVPSSTGIRQAVAVLSGIRSKHDGTNCEPLDRYIREHLGHLGAIVIDAASPREDTRWIDWYGNLEVSPPVTDRSGREFPFGRVLSGVQKDLGMHPDILGFLEAQGLQVPPLLIDTSWLLIGHVDEVVSFVPSTNRRGFYVLLPSPLLARYILEEIETQGGADLPVFADHVGETTVAALLKDVAKSGENSHIQQVLHETRAHLCEGLGVDDDDFIEVPVLFQGGVAVIPNCVNGLICNGHAILPDPLGPRVGGKDAFAEPIRSALTSLGVQVHFVDIWEPYHTGTGEIHCGTNTIRRIQMPAWWEVAGP
jgi:protein-arginine deiminase